MSKITICNVDGEDNMGQHLMRKIKDL